MERLNGGLDCSRRVAARGLNKSFLVCLFERQGDAIRLAVSHRVNLKGAVRQFGKVNPVILPSLYLPTRLLNQWRKLDVIRGPTLVGVAKCNRRSNQVQCATDHLTNVLFLIYIRRRL